MIQLAYTSIATRPMSKQDLMLLLEQARQFNQENNITGLLLYKELSFFQVIEGERETVNNLLLSILGDSRHENIGVLYIRDINERDFNDWSMGFVNLQDHELDLDGWEHEAGEFEFPLQKQAGSLVHLINIKTASKLVTLFSERI